MLKLFSLVREQDLSVKSEVYGLEMNVMAMLNVFQLLTDIQFTSSLPVHVFLCGSTSFILN